MLPELGEVDSSAGEFWVANPFLMPQEGHNLSAFERNRMFLNVGGQKFLDASRFSGADLDSDSRSVVAADFDNDGRTDLLVGSVGGGPLRLFRNEMDATANRHLDVELEGTTSNRSAIGARVTLEVGGRRIVRELFAANGCMGQAPARLSIGVGDSEIVDRLTVRWPNGSSEKFEQLDTKVMFKAIETQISP